MKSRILVTCLGFLGFIANVSHAQITYEVIGGKACVVQGLSPVSGNIVIASTFNGLPVETINPYAFQFCGNLKSVVIPDSVTEIRGDAFYFCNGLTNVVMSTNVKTIGGEAFAGCSSLKSISFPDGLLGIGDYAFNGCRSLKSVVVTATYIGNHAFSDCAGLKTVTFTERVEAMGTYPFIRCSSLTNFTVNQSNPVYKDVDGILFDKPQTSLLIFPGSVGGAYSIPEPVTKIGQAAFFGCSNLTSVGLSAKVAEVGPWAFDSCVRLKDLYIPDSVSNLHYSAFSGCRGLTNVTIGNGVSRIEASMFRGCSNLAKVIFGKGVSQVEFGIIRDCPSLTNITFLGNAPSVDFGSIFPIDAQRRVHYFYGTSGWEPMLAGIPTVMIGAAPKLESSSVVLGIEGFSFTILGIANQTFIIDASEDLLVWQPIWTNNLSSFSTNFTDSLWINQTGRFFRAR